MSTTGRDLNLVESSELISSEISTSTEATRSTFSEMPGSSKATKPMTSNPSGSSQSTSLDIRMSTGAPMFFEATITSDSDTTFEAATSSPNLAPLVFRPPDDRSSHDVSPLDTPTTDGAEKEEKKNVVSNSSGDHMAPTKSTPKEPAGGKKRKNDGSVPVAKRTKTTRKEDEKENRSKTQSPASSPSVPGCSRVSPVNVEPSRRKTKPVKLCDRQKQLSVHTEGKTLMALYGDNPNLRIQNCRFRLGSVVQNKYARAGKVIIKKRAMREIEDSLEDVIREKYEHNDHHELCTVNFNRICSWGNNMDAQNFATDAASVLSYTLIVDHQDNVKIIENGLSSVSFKHATLSDSARTAANLKNVTVTSEELNSAKYIYYAAVVRRMALFTEKRASRQSTTSSSALLDPAMLKREAGIGCIRMYDKGKPHKMNNGVQRIILVREDENPAKNMLSAEKESEAFFGWMKNASNLATLNELNANKLDAHLFRIVFETYCDDFQPTVETTSGPPPQPRVENAGFFDGNLAVAHPSTQRKHDLITARFPFFVSKQSTEGCDNGFVEDYFKEGDKITHISDWTFYKPRCNRTIAISKRAGNSADDEDESDDSEDSFTRNRAPGNRKLYGLDFVQQEGHCPFRRDIHRRRKARLLPPLNADAVESDDDDEMVEDDDDSEKNCETFPLNNPTMMTAFEMRFKKKQVIQPEWRISGSEMSVAVAPVTEQQKHIHNSKLLAANTKGMKPIARRPNPNNDPNDPNADLDGRPIPAFCELFFPEAKSDIYDIALRDYLSEVGCRPASLSAEWKSRIMTGFAIAHHKMIFEQKLEGIYMKHLQMMGMRSADWKMCHYTVPRKKFYELKREWLATQEPAQN